MAAPAVRRKSILLVEDDHDVQSALADSLRDAGLTVEVVGDGAEAWGKLISAERPDLVVLDLKLPKMSGWSLLERLRTSETLVHVPVVVVSAHMGQPPAGALAWIKKPFEPQVLVATVGRLLDGG